MEDALAPIPSSEGEYIPSLEEIAAEAALIRESWSDDDRAQRILSVPGDGKRWLPGEALERLMAWDPVKVKHRGMAAPLD